MDLKLGKARRSWNPEGHTETHISSRGLQLAGVGTFTIRGPGPLHSRTKHPAGLGAKEVEAHAVEEFRAIAGLATAPYK